MLFSDTFHFKMKFFYYGTLCLFSCVLGFSSETNFCAPEENITEILFAQCGMDEVLLPEEQPTLIKPAGEAEKTLEPSKPKPQTKPKTKTDGKPKPKKQPSGKKVAKSSSEKTAHKPIDMTTVGSQRALLLAYRKKTCQQLATDVNLTLTQRQMTMEKLECHTIDYHNFDPAKDRFLQAGSQDGMKKLVEKFSKENAKVQIPVRS